MPKYLATLLGQSENSKELGRKGFGLVNFIAGRQLSLWSRKSHLDHVDIFSWKDKSESEASFEELTTLKHQINSLPT